MFYRLMADFLSTVHTAYVAFVFFGLVVTLIGKFAGWKWVSNRWFRGIHLAMILLVVARTTVMDFCPLTTWEAQFRELGLQQGYGPTAFGQAMHDAIHPPQDIPVRIYHLIYAIFAALVLATLWLVPVNWRPKRHKTGEVAPAR